jgi:hypothetical protein
MATTDDDGFEYIRKNYHVPARVGGRIRYTGSQSGKPRDGTIVRAAGQYLVAEMDPDGEPPLMGVFHPTWEIEYLPGE